MWMLALALAVSVTFQLWLSKWLLCHQVGYKVLWWVCLFVCLFLCLSTCITRKLHGQNSPSYLCMLPVAMVWSSSDGIARCYVLPVLWMMSCFHTKWQMGRIKHDVMFRRVHQVALSVQGVYNSWKSWKSTGIWNPSWKSWKSPWI